MLGNLAVVAILQVSMVLPSQWDPVLEDPAPHFVPPAHAEWANGSAIDQIRNGGAPDTAHTEKRDPESPREEDPCKCEHPPKKPLPIPVEPIPTPPPPDPTNPENPKIPKPPPEPVPLEP